jgi:aminoglycoside 2'-N-acetyltransferase I
MRSIAAAPSVRTGLICFGQTASVVAVPLCPTRRAILLEDGDKSSPGSRDTAAVIVSFPEAETPVELRRQIRQIQHQAWPDHLWPTGPSQDDDAAGTAVSLVHDPALLPQTMALVEDGIVVAALDILTKNINHGGNCFRAGGLSTVATHIDRRGQGYGHRLVRHAREAMAQNAHDLGIFTCDRPLLTFYERAGWENLPGTVLLGGTPEHPFPSDQPDFDKVTVGAFFCAAAQRSRRQFAAARVELYPGSIDKLW